MKNKIATIGIIIATLILAGVAVFTAIRLYQLRKEAVAPTAPTSKPKAQVVPIACQSLAFTLGQTPTPTPTGRCEPVTGAYWCSNPGKIVLTVDHDVTNWSGCLSWCNLNMTTDTPLCQYNADGPRNCWVKEAPVGGINSCIWLPKPPYGSCYQATATATPTRTPTLTPTPTSTPTGTPTATPTNPPLNICGGTCGSNSNCQSDFVCYQGFCRNLSCTGEADCSCQGEPNLCGGTCGANSNCKSPLFCYEGFCRNTSCPSQTNCTCPTGATATPRLTATPRVTATLIAGATPTGEPALPNAGISFPTIFGIGLGTILLIGALLLAI